MINVLFVCIHNSARSQMAQTFLNELGNGKFHAESAGIEPGKLNPNVVAVMQEIGIDISNNPVTGVFDLLKAGKTFDAVITVCDAANGERCPVFPGKTKRLAWFFTDPSSFTGTLEEKLEGTRKVRGEIRKKIAAFVEEASNISYWI